MSGVNPPPPHIFNSQGNGIMEDKEVKVDEVSIEEAANTDTPQSNQTTADADTVQTADCTAQVDALIAEVKELNDKYLRAAAELENTRRRAALDCESAARNRAMSIAGKFLPVMDAIDAALKHNPEDAGINAMARAMNDAFAQIGIVRIESVGQVLNPQFHNAIQLIDAPAGQDPRPAPNTIIEEMQPGYMFADNVLRTAMVVVCK